MGLDIGTTSVKAVVADEAGNIVGRHRHAERAHRRADGPLRARCSGHLVGRPPGTAARNPRTVEGVGAAGAASGRGLGDDALVAAVDASGRPIGPGLLYGDSRGQPPQSRWPRGRASRVGRRRRDSDPTASDEMACLAGWAAADVPGAAGYWPAQAVANASLGGEGVTDLASAFASGTLFGEGGWQPSVCEARRLFSRRSCPRVAFFGERIGEVDPAVVGGLRCLGQ